MCGQIRKINGKREEEDVLSRNRTVRVIIEKELM